MPDISRWPPGVRDSAGVKMSPLGAESVCFMRPRCPTKRWGTISPKEEGRLLSKNVETAGGGLLPPDQVHPACQVR